MKLIVAEKPSVAKAIAPIVGADKKENGCLTGGGYTVTWCHGHLVQLFLPQDYSEELKRWSFDTLPIIPKDWKLKILDGAQKQFSIVKRLMNSSAVTEIICATDADREGECIFRYTYMLAGCRKPVKRLWTSSLEVSALSTAMAELKNDKAYDDLFAAGYSRAKADWLVGINATRLFSCRYSNKLTVGRVQTPTLAMIVQRDYDIEHFVKQKYYTVELDCGSFKAISERINDIHKVRSIISAVSGKTAEVIEVNDESKTLNPPKLFDLTTLQRTANKYFGYTAKQTLDHLQSLYEKKLATYPRTDSQYITDDMEETAANEVGIVFSCFPEYVDIPYTIDVKRCINNKKVSGHHAILPTAELEGADLSTLSDGERNILKLISARLVLAVSAPHKYRTVKAHIRCAGYDFSANGKTVIDNGWKTAEEKIKAVLKNKNSDDETKDDTDTALPDISQGDIFENVLARSAEHFTSPPKPFTEASLLTAMEYAGNENYSEYAEIGEDIEKKGLGTPATRAAIIENLVKIQYVKRDGKKLISTSKGKELIAAVPEEVKSVATTAEWETQLQRIAKGQISADSFIDEIENHVKNMTKSYSSSAENTVLSTRFEAIGKCPRCGAEVRSYSKVYACEKGKEACGFGLPKNICKKDISETQAAKLLEKGRTDVLKGFIGKSGKSFSAFLSLQDDMSVKLELPEYETKVVGICPRCGCDVTETPKAFSCCGGKGCGFTLWKEDKKRGIKVSAASAASLLKGKTATLSAVNSKGEKYKGTFELVDTGKYVNLRYVAKKYNGG